MFGKEAKKTAAASAKPHSASPVKVSAKNPATKPVAAGKGAAKPAASGKMPEKPAKNGLSGKGKKNAPRMQAVGTAPLPPKPEKSKHKKGASKYSAPSVRADGKHELRIGSLYKTFGKKTVVRGVDFSIATGEVLGLLGPNGAGKTTTFYMIVGFLNPTRGEVFLNETRITRLPMFQRARLGIAYLPQEPSVFKKLTVEQNIWAIIEGRKDMSYAEKTYLLESLISDFAIGHIRKQPAFTLSGGERRRTEIARSLATDPKFLLLDEPFAGIDPIAVADIKNMIGLLSDKKIGILITDHNVRDTLEITDRAIIISDGQIVVQGGQKEILDSPIARKIYLGAEFRM